MIDYFTLQLKMIRHCGWIEGGQEQIMRGTQIHRKRNLYQRQRQYQVLSRLLETITTPSQMQR